MDHSSIQKQLKVNIERLTDAFLVKSKNELTNSKPRQLALWIILAAEVVYKNVQPNDLIEIPNNSKPRSLELNRLKKNLEGRLQKFQNSPDLRKRNWLLTVEEWINVLKFYLEENALNQLSKVDKIPVKIKRELLNNQLSSIEKQITILKKGELDMQTQNTKLSLISPDYISECLLEDIPTEAIELFEEAAADYLPNLFFIKDQPICLKFDYEDGGYDLDLFVLLLNRVTDEGFTETMVFLIDYNVENQQDRVVIDFIKPVEVAKYVENLINNREISYVSQDTVSKLYIYIDENGGI